MAQHLEQPPLLPPRQQQQPKDRQCKSTGSRRWRRVANQTFLPEAVTLKDKTLLTLQQLKRTQHDWPRIRGHSRHSQKPLLSLVRNSFLIAVCTTTDCFPVLASPAKPRNAASKFDAASTGNRTVGQIPRRSTTLYEKTSSTEKTNASTDNTWVDGDSF